MPEQPETWEKYGFPDPTFRTPYLPYVGLCKALNERANYNGEGEDIIEIPDKFSCFDSSVWFYLLYAFDTAFTKVAVSGAYVNPEKYDDLDEDSDVSDMCWTWEDLLLAGADGVEADVIDLNANPPPKLLPNWSAKWAKQRYKMLNLLRYPVVDAQYTYKIGQSGHQSTTKHEAYQNAVSNSSLFGPVSSGPFSQFYGVHTSPQIYFAEIYKMIKFAPVLPIGFLNIDAWAVANIIRLNDSAGFNAFGLDITLGWNKWTAVNGSYIDSPDLPPYISAWDSVDDIYVGFDSGAGEQNNALCYADFNPVFNFKEDDE